MSAREHSNHHSLILFALSALHLSQCESAAQTAVDFYHGTASGQIGSLIASYSLKLFAVTGQFAMTITRYFTFAAST